MCECVVSWPDLEIPVSLLTIKGMTTTKRGRIAIPRLVTTSTSMRTAIPYTRSTISKYHRSRWT